MIRICPVITVVSTGFFRGPDGRCFLACVFIAIRASNRLSHASTSVFIRVPPRISLRDRVVRVNSPRVFYGKVGSIEKWLLIVIVVLGAVCLLCCVCCIIHVGTCGIL